MAYRRGSKIQAGGRNGEIQRTGIDMPVPLRPTNEGEFAAVLVIVRLPLVVPGLFGVNVTFSGILWPAFNVIGIELPVKANGPETEMLLIVTASVLLFETDMDCAGLGWLTITLPRSKAVGARGDSD